MSNAFTKLPREKLNSTVANLLCQQIKEILKDRGPGHCMRVTDLESEIMEMVCKELRHSCPCDNVFILAGHDQEDMEYRITSTKLVELRNPESDGKLRPPLLVFIPASLRTSAEDSFGVATFEELTFTSIYEKLTGSLIERFPATLIGHIRDIFSILSEEKWQFADDLARVRYLLTALENGQDGETLGASLYELTLIPDFKLFANPETVNGQVRRNLNSIRSMMGSSKSFRGRIASLRLTDNELKTRLFSFFDKYDVQDPDIWTESIAIDKNYWNISFDKWTFQGEISREIILLTVQETDLPVVKEDETDEHLSGLIGQQVLVPSERRKMNVVFEVSPHPSKVAGLDHFTIQIVSQNDGPVGKSKKIKAWTSKRNQATVNLDKLNKILESPVF